MRSTAARGLLALIVAAFALPGEAHAQIVYVDGALTTGSDDGSSWANAFQGSTGLHQALAAAAPGEEIWVTGGTYLPSLSGDIDRSFELRTDDLQLRGGFSGTESTRFQRPAPGLHPTILSGDLGGNDDATSASRVDNSRVVLRADGDHVLVENIEVVAAQASPSSHPSPFTGNLLGGLTAVVSAGLTLEHCHFRDNQGVGAWIAGDGQGIALRILDCHFERNRGVGLYVGHELSFLTSTEISRCSSTDNGATGFLIVPDSNGSGQLSNCLAARNMGHGLRYVLLPEGGLLRNVRNCTFVENTLSGVRMDTCQCFSYQAIVWQSILWGNGASLGGGAIALNSIVQGQTNPALGILGADPEFRDPAAGDYCLLPGSPAIDRGPASSPVSFGPQVPLPLGQLDLARSYRAVDLPGVANAGPGPDDFVDYGAFEFTGTIGENAGCAALPNSTGRAGRMFARGSLDVAAGNFALRADRVPPGEFGLFLASTELRALPSPAPAAGLCLGGAIGRFIRPGEIQMASTGGIIALPVDLASIPQPSAFLSAQAGDTWHFQLWHRDGPTSSAFTGTVSATLR